MLGAATCLVAGAVFTVALLAGWTTVQGRGAALGVSLILLGLILAVWSADTWLDLTPRSVLTAEGYLRPTERIVSGRYGSRTIYAIEIGNQTFGFLDDWRATGTPGKPERESEIHLGPLGKHKIPFTATQGLVGSCALLVILITSTAVLTMRWKRRRPK